MQKVCTETIEIQIVSITEAARLKNTSRQTTWAAAVAGTLNSVTNDEGAALVYLDEKFRAWTVSRRGRRGEIKNRT